MKPVERAKRAPFARLGELEWRWSGCRKIDDGRCDPDEQTHEHCTVVVVGMIDRRFARRTWPSHVAFEVRVNLVRAMMVGRVLVRMRVQQRR